MELKPGTYLLEWMDAAHGVMAGEGRIDAPGGQQPFKSDFQEDAVLRLKAAD